MTIMAKMRTISRLAGAGVRDLRAGEKSGKEPGLKYSGDAKRAILDNVLTEMLKKYTWRPDSKFCFS